MSVRMGCGVWPCWSTASAVCLVEGATPLAACGAPKTPAVVVRGAALSVAGRTFSVVAPAPVRCSACSSRFDANATINVCCHIAWELQSGGNPTQRWSERNCDAALCMQRELRQSSEPSAAHAYPVAMLDRRDAQQHGHCRTCRDQKVLESRGSAVAGGYAFSCGVVAAGHREWPRGGLFRCC